MNRGLFSQRRKSFASGYTMLEATIALMMLLLGILGMGALAGASVRSNMEAHERTQATHLAEKLLGMMRTEAMSWNENPWNPTADVSDPDVFMPLLSALPTGLGTGNTGFIELTQRMGSVQAFTRDLRMVDPDNELATFCTHYRLTWLQPHETIRAEVRVYWMRRGANPTLYSFYDNCGSGNVQAMANDAFEIRSVSRTGLLSRNVSGGTR